MAKRKTQEQFEQDVYNKLGKNYKILSPYPGGHGKVLMQHLVCNNIFEKNVHDIITKAKHYIDEHLAEDLSVSSIAASLYITPNYFSRLFKRVMKEGCNEYIVRKRIEKAKSLLETTSLKTGKIAMMVGYRDTNYFSLAFKKHTGKSPTKYREEVQGNN